MSFSVQGFSLGQDIGWVLLGAPLCPLQPFFPSSVLESKATVMGSDSLILCAVFTIFALMTVLVIFRVPSDWISSSCVLCLAS